MSKQREIPIVFATDRNYLAPCYMALFSAGKNMSRDIKYTFFVLLPDTIQKEELISFEKLSSQNDSIDICFCHISDDEILVIEQNGFNQQGLKFEIKSLRNNLGILRFKGVVS